MSELDAMAQCAWCPRLCRHVCPPLHAESRETVSPTSLLTLLMLEHHGTLPADPALAELVGHCVQCGRCTDACLHEATPYEILREARGRLGTARVVGAESAASWPPAPFGPVGGGSARWWLVGSLIGLDLAEVHTALAADPLRRWTFPAGALPTELYAAWALGDIIVWHGYLERFRLLLAAEAPVGVAWADPHEGKAVQAALDALDYEGERGYAPVLLGISTEAARGCGDLTQVDGCCGGAGGYPAVAPDAARRLAERFVVADDARLPGICLAHLAGCGRTGYRSDWSGR